MSVVGARNENGRAARLARAERFFCLRLPRYDKVYAPQQHRQKQRQHQKHLQEAAAALFLQRLLCRLLLLLALAKQFPVLLGLRLHALLIEPPGVFLV